MSYPTVKALPLLTDTKSTTTDGTSQVTNDQSINETKLIVDKRKREDSNEDGGEEADGRTMLFILDTSLCTNLPTVSQSSCTNITSSGQSHLFKNTPNVSTSSDQSLSILNSCLDILLYQDGNRRPLTPSLLKLAEDAKSKVGEANALFLEGLCFPGGRLKRFLEAEAKGCDHPVMYYFMGECHRGGDDAVEENDNQALVYYDKAIAGI